MSLSFIVLAGSKIRFEGACEKAGLSARKEALWDKAAYVLDLILTQQARNAGKLWRAPVPLYSVTLQKVLGADRRRVVDLLRDAQIIIGETWEQQSRGASRSYSIRPAFQSAEVERHIVSKVTLQRSVRAVRNGAGAKAARKCAARRFVMENLKRVTLSAEDESVLGNDTEGGQLRQVRRMDSLTCLMEGRIWLSEDKVSGRIFHPVTNCPSDVRRHLRINNEQVVEVDIANAQPIFLFKRYPTPDVWEDPYKPGPAYEVGDESKAFAECVGKGEFYETLYRNLDTHHRKHWGNAIGDLDPERRGEFKEATFSQTLFSKAEGAKLPLMEAFERAFPWLARHVWDCCSAPKGNSALARDLQRCEATLMFDGIIPRIKAEVAGCYPITIHDGILVQAQFGQAVKRVMEEELLRFLGVPATVRVKGQSQTQ